MPDTSQDFLAKAPLAAVSTRMFSRRRFVVSSTWPAVVPGVAHDDFTTEEYTTPLYGEGNLPDPWSNPQIQRIQKAFHPLLVADTA